MEGEAVVMKQKGEVIVRCECTEMVFNVNVHSFAVNAGFPNVLSCFSNIAKGIVNSPPVEVDFVISTRNC